MNAKYFYDRLAHYDEDVLTSRHTYNGYSRKRITIKRTSTGEKYVLYRKGYVYKVDDRNMLLGGTYKLDELQGDDYILYPSFFVVACGYLVVSNTSKNMKPSSIIDLYYNASSKDNGQNVFTKFIDYDYSNKNAINILIYIHGKYEIELMTGSFLTKWNQNRTSYDLNQFPSSPNIDTENSLYIALVSNTYSSQNEIDAEIENIIRELNRIDVDISWIPLDISQLDIRV